MRHPLLAPDLSELIQDRSADALREFFAGHHPADAAELLDDLRAEEAVYVLGLLDGRLRASIFSYLEPELQDGAAEQFERGDLAALLTFMSHDERADLVSRLAPERVEQIMPLLARAEREDIRRLASYGENTAGAVMTSDYVALAAELTAAEAIDRLRREAPDRETIYYCYVVDQERRLTGFVSLKDLILAPAAKRVGQIMQRGVVSVHVDDDREKAAAILREYDLIALPIVDGEDRLVGIVTHDDVLDVVVEEATEDVYRMAGVAPLEGSYLSVPFPTLWGKRVVWLAILFVAGFLTTTALTRFQDSFETVSELVLFLPLIISAGGNCGAQSTTLITRALALDEVRPADWARVLVHEVLMGASLGLALGCVGFAGAWIALELRPAPLVGVHAVEPYRLGLIVALGVWVVVLWGNLVGGLLPLVLKRLGLDPALMSNPVVASLCDVTGIVTYFSIASAVLG